MQENLSLYHIFYTVSRTGNISSAAKELYISQPGNLSGAIVKNGIFSFGKKVEGSFYFFI